MPGVAHMASLKIVLERNKKQKAKMQLTDFEKFMQEQVLGERAGEKPARSGE